MSLLLPMYLLGLTGLALPWLLHRFSRTRPEEKSFPSTRFLEATLPPVSRRRQLRYRWLLLLRIGLLTALCLLFAEPLWRFGESLRTTERLRLIVIDQSFSMQLDDRIERARRAALDAIDTLAVGETLQVLSAGGSLASLGEPTADKAEARAALRQLEAGFARTDYGELMQRLDVIAAGAGQPVDVLLITDAQASALPQRLGSLVAGSVSSLQIVDISAATDANQYLRAEASLYDGVHARVVVDVGASVLTPAGAAVERELLVRHGRSVLAREAVLLEEGAQRAVVFDRVILPDEPVSTLSVGFRQRDGLPADDLVDVVLRGSDPIEVVISNQLGRTDTPAPVFIATALSTDDGVRVLDTSATGALPDGARHAVVISDAAGLPPDIQRFVARGGNVLLVQATQDETPALRPAAPVDIDAAHPLALGETDWYPVRYYGTASLRVTAQDRVLMRTADGSPLLVERTVLSDNPASGRLLVLGDPLDARFSDLPLQPAFVDFIRAVIDWFVSSSVLPERITAGSRVHLPAGAQVIDSDGETLRSFAETGEAADMSFDTPGVYTVLGEQLNQRIEVHVDMAESLLARLPVAELRAWEQRHGQMPAERVGSDARATAGGSTADAPQTASVPLWYTLLIMLTLLIIAEPLMANRGLDIRRDGS